MSIQKNFATIILIVFTPRLGNDVSHNVVLEQITQLKYRPSLCVNQRARNQSNESQKITSQYEYSRLGKVTKTSVKIDVRDIFRLWRAKNLMQMFNIRPPPTHTDITLNFLLSKLRTCCLKHTWDNLGQFLWVLQLVLTLKFRTYIDIDKPQVKFSFSGVCF